MRSARISEEVWDAIASRGKFGESVDDVLRRVFQLPPNRADSGTAQGNSVPRANRRRRSGPRGSFATVRMHASVKEGVLFVSFANGAERNWDVPSKRDKLGIRAIRDEAVEFARLQGGTIGQQNAVKKALTDAGYYVSR